jgi:hypothetical protein
MNAPANPDPLVTLGATVRYSPEPCPALGLAHPSELANRFAARATSVNS